MINHLIDRSTIEEEDMIDAEMIGSLCEFPLLKMRGHFLIYCEFKGL